MPLAFEANRLHAQRLAVTDIEALGGVAVYDRYLTGHQLQIVPGDTDIDAQLAEESGVHDRAGLIHFWDRFRDRVVPEDFGCRVIGIRFFPADGKYATDDAMIAVGKLSDIEFLDLNGGGWQGTGKSGYLPVTDTCAAHLAHLRSLRWLDLAGCRISDSTLGVINCLPHIECLFLSDTRVSDEGMSLLCGLTELRELHLNNTDITDKGLLALGRCKKLTVLEIHGTHATREGVRTLTQQLSGCEIRETTRTTAR